MNTRKSIQAQLKGRIFHATFTKRDGSTRRAYGQILNDERLEDLPQMITYCDFTVGGIRRIDLSNGAYTIRSGKTIIESESA